MNKLKLSTYGTLVLAIGLAIFLVNRIKFSIDEETCFVTQGLEPRLF